MLLKRFPLFGLFFPISLLPFSLFTRVLVIWVLVNRIVSCGLDSAEKERGTGLLFLFCLLFVGLLFVLDSGLSPISANLVFLTWLFCHGRDHIGSEREKLI